MARMRLSSWTAYIGFLAALSQWLAKGQRGEEVIYGKSLKAATLKRVDAVLKIDLDLQSG